jgi:hypothetical protein
MACALVFSIVGVYTLIWVDIRIRADAVRPYSGPTQEYMLCALAR